MNTLYIEESNSAIKQIKIGVWVYFFLLIFEGALRKWVLPGLSTPLLVVRDPVAIWLIFMALKNKLFTYNLSLIGIPIAAIAAMFFTLFVGHGNVVVMLYGLRIFLIHFPVIFVIAAVFNRDDVVFAGKLMLWLCIPFTILVAMQFYSPQSAWVNIGVGGDEGAGFSGALGFQRPPGVFSFTNGNTLFFSLVANFVCYFLIDNKSISIVLLYVSAFFLIVAIPLAISRTLVFQCVIFIVFTLLAVMNRPTQLRNTILALLVVVLIFVFLSQTSFFQTSITVFMARFDNANATEGGLESVLMDRYLGGMLGALSTGGDMPFWGYGLGMGSNAGSQLLTGERVFLISEGEWGRIIGEFGAFLGLSVIFFRLELAVEILVRAIKKLYKGDVLPFILTGACLLLLPQAQWAQPTALGFAVAVSGLTMASFNTNE